MKTSSRTPSKQTEREIMSDIYDRLVDKLDTLGKGYPRTKRGKERSFLEKLFTEEDAAFHIKMRRGSHTAAETAQYMGISVAEATENLERMAHRHLIFWQYGPGDTEKRYRLIPFVHGLWEFNPDKIERDDVMAKGYHMLNGFGEALFDYRLPIVRVVPTRADTVKDDALLPIDDVRENIKKQNLIIAADCVCRITSKFGKPCDCYDTLSCCIMFGDMARFYLEENVANTRVITVNEALAIVDDNDRLGYVTTVGHSSEYSAICNCPSCHCGLMLAARISNKSGPKHGKQTFERWGNYKCEKDDALCTDCGACVSRCPLRALSSSDDGAVTLEPGLCIGCGLCVTKCPTSALILTRKPQEELNLPEDAIAFDVFDRMAAEKIIIDEERRLLAAAEEQ
jgi:ferredoxin